MTARTFKGGSGMGLELGGRSCGASLFAEMHERTQPRFILCFQ